MIYYNIISIVSVIAGWLAYIMDKKLITSDTLYEFSFKDIPIVLKRESILFWLCCTFAIISNAIS